MPFALTPDMNPAASGAAVLRVLDFVIGDFMSVMLPESVGVVIADAEAVAVDAELTPLLLRVCGTVASDTGGVGARGWGGAGVAGRRGWIGGSSSSSSAVSSIISNASAELLLMPADSCRTAFFESILSIYVRVFAAL